MFKKIKIASGTLSVLSGACLIGLGVICIVGAPFTGGLSIVVPALFFVAGITLWARGVLEGSQSYVPDVEEYLKFKEDFNEENPEYFESPNRGRINLESSSPSLSDGSIDSQKSDSGSSKASAESPLDRVLLDSNLKNKPKSFKDLTNRKTSSNSLAEELSPNPNRKTKNESRGRLKDFFWNLLGSQQPDKPKDEDKVENKVRITYER